MNTPPASVVLYTLGGCGHCTTARRLLQRLDIPFEEHRLDGVTDFRGLLVERTGGWTVPQILIGGEPIGGASDLARLQRRGVLLARVNGDTFPVAVVRRRPAPGRMLAALLTRPGGARRAAWRDSVELRDRDGRVVERRAPSPVDDARTATADQASAPIESSRRRTRSARQTRSPTKRPVPMTKVLTLTHADYEREVLGSEVPVLVDYWAPWCGPCRTLGPVIEEIAAEHAGALKVAKVNVDDEPELADLAGVQGIPLVVLYRDGRPVARAVGAQPKAELKRTLGLDSDMPSAA